MTNWIAEGHSITRKLKGKSDRLIERALNRILLRRMTERALADSEILYVFSPSTTFTSADVLDYYSKLYLWVAYELAGRGYPSVFLSRNDFLAPYFPELEVDGICLSNSLIPARGGSKRIPRKNLAVVGG